MRHINEIIIHCTATRPEWMQDSSVQDKVKEIDRWHRERGFSQIGYHFIVDRDGSIGEGRPIAKTGAHVKGHNTGTVGISLVGGHGGASDDAFSDNFTEAQDRALRKLIAKLLEQYPSIIELSGHNDYTNAKTCPTFQVGAWFDNKPAAPVKERTSPTQSKTVQASVVQGASAIGGAVGALNALDGTAQIVALVGCILIAGLAMFIMRERLRAWSSGWR